MRLMVCGSHAVPCLWVIRGESIAERSPQRVCQHWGHTQSTGKEVSNVLVIEPFIFLSQILITVSPLSYLSSCPYKGHPHLLVHACVCSCVHVHICVCESVRVCVRTRVWYVCMCVHELGLPSDIIFLCYFLSLNLEFTTQATLASQQAPIPLHLSLAPPELRLQVRITTLRLYAGLEIQIQDLMPAQPALSPLIHLPRLKLLSSDGSSCVLDSRLLGNDAIYEYFLQSHNLYFHCFNTVFQSLNFSF